MPCLCVAPHSWEDSFMSFGIIRNCIFSFINKTVSNLNYNNKSYKSNNSIYHYLRYPNTKFDKDLKSEYDRAIKINKRKVWEMAMEFYDIQAWEKLYEDKELGSFFNKVNKMISD